MLALVKTNKFVIGADTQADCLVDHFRNDEGDNE
jgi:hypothetical protein